AHPSRESLLSSNADDPSSARNSSMERGASASKTCGTTHTRESESHGKSTWGGVTRLTDVEPQTGQRTATPTVAAAGARSRKEDGVTGRGASSGEQKKLQGPSPPARRSL